MYANVVIAEEERPGREENIVLYASNYPLRVVVVVIEVSPSRLESSIQSIADQLSSTAGHLFCSCSSRVCEGNSQYSIACFSQSDLLFLWHKKQQTTRWTIFRTL